MSQGIMEKNLPVADSIQSGDKIRIVTSAGNSKQVDASQIGGGGALKVTATFEYNSQDELIGGSLDKIYREIENAQALMFVATNMRGIIINYAEFFLVSDEERSGVSLIRRDSQGAVEAQLNFAAQTKDDTLVLQLNE